MAMWYRRQVAVQPGGVRITMRIRMLLPVSLGLFLSLVHIAFSQPVRSIAASRFESGPAVDGDPSDAVWTGSEASAGFVQFEPQHDMRLHGRIGRQCRGR